MPGAWSSLDWDKRSASLGRSSPCRDPGRNCQAAPTSPWHLHRWASVRHLTGLRRTNESGRSRKRDSRWGWASTHAARGAAPLKAGKSVELHSTTALCTEGWSQLLVFQPHHRRPIIPLSPRDSDPFTPARLPRRGKAVMSGEEEWMESYDTWSGMSVRTEASTSKRDP